MRARIRTGWPLVYTYTNYKFSKIISMTKEDIRLIRFLAAASIFSVFVIWFLFKIIDLAFA